MFNSKGGVHLACLAKADCSTLQVVVQPNATVVPPLHEYLEEGPGGGGGGGGAPASGVKLCTAAPAKSSALP